MNNVPDEYHGNASFYGLQVTRRGELQTFQSYWDEVVIINLPQQSEYEGFLASVDDYCNSMHTKQFSPYEDNETGPKAMPRGQWIKNEMRERCMRTKRQVRDIVTELVDAAFKLSMPQPSSTQTESLSMITNADEFHMHFGELEDENENVLKNISVLKSLPLPQPLTDPTTVPSIHRNESESIRRIDEMTTHRPDSVTHRFDDLSFFPNMSTVNLTNSAFFSEYDTPYSGTSGENIVREKRAIFTLSILAITAIASLLATSVTGASIAINNKVKIEQMQKKVSKLVDLSREQDTESIALRDFMIGMTTDHVGKFNRTSNVLGNVLQIQQIFSRTINATAANLRKYSKGDALANTIFLNLHEEQDFITKVTAVIDGARRVITSYEQGIISLYQNQLSTAFVTHSQLRAILFKVRHNLPQGYTLAFEMGQLENYYFHKLCQHTKVGNQLILRITIPLSTVGITPSLPFYTPVYHTVPLPREWEKASGLLTSGNFYRINENALYWILRNGKFESVVDRDHLSCSEAGNYLKCIRFEPTPSIIPSNCVKALMEGNFTPEVIFNTAKKACKPQLDNSANYKIMRLDDENMVLHGSTLLNYRKICRGLKPEPIQVAEDNLMKIVHLEPGCQIEMNGVLSPGPIYRLDSSNTTINMSAGIRSVVFTNSSARYPIPLPVEVLGMPFSTDVNISFQPSELSSSKTFFAELSRLKRQTDEMRERVENYNATFKDDEVSINQVADFIEARVVQHLNTFLLVLIALYSFANRNFLVLTAANFSFLVQSAEATVTDVPVMSTLVTWYKVYENLRMPDWELLVQIACLTFIIVNIMIKNLCNDTKMIDIFGRINNDDQYNIAFVFESAINKKCYRLEETITILHPLRIQLSLDIVRIEVVTPIRNFLIVNDMITLQKPLVFQCIDSNGKPINGMDPLTVSFGMRSVTWYGNRPDTKFVKGGRCRAMVIANPFIKS